MDWKVYRIETPLENYEVKAENKAHVDRYVGYVRLRYLDMAVWCVKGLAPYEYNIKVVDTRKTIKVGKGSKICKRIDEVRPDIPYSNHGTGINKPEYREGRRLVAKAYAGSLAYGIAINASDEDLISIPIPIQSELDGKTKFPRTSGDEAIYTVWDIVEMCLGKGRSIPAYEYVFSPLLDIENMQIYLAMRNLVKENFASGMLTGLWGSFSEHQGYFNDPKPVILKSTGEEKHSAEYMKRKGLAHMWRLSTVALSIGQRGFPVFPCGDKGDREIVKNYREHGTNETYILNKVAWNIEQVKGKVKTVSKKIRLRNLDKFRAYLSQVIRP